MLAPQATYNLPDLLQVASAPSSAYVHIPFCRVRCGYCDFNTYAHEFGQGADLQSYHQSVINEIKTSARQLRDLGTQLQPLETVFFGGGTPTMLPVVALTEILQALQQYFGLSPGAEVTLESNPETVTESDFHKLRAAGFTRVSIGMQSADPQVLQTLDRQHRPERVPLVVQWAQKAGLQTSVDLIYGAPAETLSQWQYTLEKAVHLNCDHISAYSLIVEPGTKMHRLINRAELPAPDEDLQAEKYLHTEKVLNQAGYRWYEISNWARAMGDGHDKSTVCRHNLAYWRTANWWGFGPGAHSHLNGHRFWNLRHPRAYAEACRRGLAIVDFERLKPSQQRLENVMLQLRTRSGIDFKELDSGSQKRALALREQGLIEITDQQSPRLVLTLKGRLLADLVTRELT